MTTREDLAKLTEQRRREFPQPATPTPLAAGDWTAAAEEARTRAACRPDLTVVADLEAQHRAAERDARMSVWHRQIPSRFATADVDQLDGDLATVAAEWDGRQNVLLLGSVGVGKTHAAIALARRAYADGTDVQFRPAVELLDDLRPGGPENTMRSATDVDLLVLDDLGSERPTDWTGERLYRLVNRRWLEQRPTIVTSNLSAGRLEEIVGGRMWSRLWHGALAVEVAGDDRRRTT